MVSTWWRGLPAYCLDRAGLRSGFTLALRQHEPNLGANCKIGEPHADNGVFVEVDLERIRRFQETIPFVWEELGDAPVCRLGVPLDLAALFANLILKLTPSGSKGIPERDVYISVRLVFGTLVTHDDFTASHGDVYSNIVQMSALLMPMRRFDDHIAVHDAIVVSIQFRRTLSYPRFNSR